VNAAPPKIIAMLGDVVDILSGFPFKSEKFSNTGDMPVVRIRDVKRGHSNTFYTGEYESRYIVQDGDLLIGMDGEFNRERWRGGRALLNQRVCKLMPNSRRIAPNFLYHFLPRALKEIEDRTPFATVKHLSANDIREIQIPLPPLDEQRRIASILDKADALRRKRERALDLLDSLPQFLFIDMFGRPGDNTSPVPQRKLGEIAELINGDRSSNYPSGDDIVESGILFLNTTNIGERGLDLRDARYITEQKFNSLTRGKLAPDDIVITLRGTLGQTAIFENAGATGFINAQMMIIRPRQSIQSRYLLQALKLDEMLVYFQQIGSGSAVPQLTAKQMSEIQIPVPDVRAQEAFGRRRDAIGRVLKGAMLQAQHLETLFLSLQHHAFSGEL